MKYLAWDGDRFFQYLIVLNAKDPEYEEYCLTGTAYDSCPVCDATISEENDRCPECGIAVIWENSRKWKRAFGLTVTRAIEQARLKPVTNVEKELLRAMNVTTFNKSVISNLNKLRGTKYSFAREEILRAADFVRTKKLRPNTAPAQRAAIGYLLAQAKPADLEEEEIGGDFEF